METISSMKNVPFGRRKMLAVVMLLSVSGFGPGVDGSLGPAPDYAMLFAAKT